jgi:hypothetical protein
MNKKGDLSINIIVVAAIAMIILVVISVLVFRSGGQLNKARSCEGIPGGICIDRALEGSCREYGDWMGQSYTHNPTAGCERDGYICCVPL